MSFNSFWFAGDDRLKRALAFDPAAVKLGEVGAHVARVQDAFRMIGERRIDRWEVAAHRFGRSTQAVVREYNEKHQLGVAASDAVVTVGRTTLEALDRDLFARQKAAFRRVASRHPFLNQLLAMPAAEMPAAKCIVATESSQPWRTWAQQFQRTFGPSGLGDVVVVGAGPMHVVAAALASAARRAGPGGFLVLSVGHGGDGETGQGNEGFFDLGPQRSFRVGGQNSWMPGFPPPKSASPHERPVHVNAFYDVSTQEAAKSVKIQDERQVPRSAGATQRLANWSQYRVVADAFRTLSGVLLLTCKVGSSSAFLERVGQTWGCPVLGYRRRVMGLIDGRARVFLEGDEAGSDSNTQWGELLFPVTDDLVIPPR